MNTTTVFHTIVLQTIIIFGLLIQYIYVYLYWSIKDEQSIPGKYLIYYNVISRLVIIIIYLTVYGAHYIVNIFKLLFIV